MTSLVSSLAHEAMLESIEVRDGWKRELDEPLDVYALCDDMRVKVRFVDIPSMEGLYGRDDRGKAVILLSSLRPLPRRAFTCAHELAHHVFGHGGSVDEFFELADRVRRRKFEPNEFIANAFAGFLLMPTLGVRKAFALRGWQMPTATPEQVFTIACHFGVGYETLIGHMSGALRSITRGRAEELRKDSPKSIRERLIGIPSPEPLVIVDEFWALPTVDIEVGTRLLLPGSATADLSGALALVASGAPAKMRQFRAVRPGITRVTVPGIRLALFVRVARFQFVGLARYRHLEGEENENE